MKTAHLVWSLLTCFLFVLAASAAEPELVSVEKIWDAGKHNAFTDLIRWHDQWYCTFREADAHVGGDGQLRVLVSPDGKTWTSAALIGEKGIDLRDPKFSITPDDRLMIVAGGSVYEGTTLKGRQPRVTFSKDGKEWSPTARTLNEGDWLWRVTWHNGKCYGICYDASERASDSAKKAAETGKAEPGPADWKLKLVVSDDGVKYNLITHLDVPGHPNESTIRFLPDGEMVALVRREGGSKNGWIGRSSAPYKDWQWTETKHRFGGPNFTRLPDGELWASGRVYPGGAKTALIKMTKEGEYEPVLTLKSSGDTSYPGMVWHEGQLWLSFYSSHEGKTSIYLAKLKVPLKSETK
ncbi:exo-alpha-sialidase [Anatilimnocola sp. NA78]|uniref:exo-alpha-sialidase n=1 Tax=Anatilimnocola sp. NA78 TaxID=3415683 RepID=UPI003CE4CDA4